MKAVVWLLTLYLAGVPIYEERDAQWQEKDCKHRGWELVRWYQQDHIQVSFTCDSTVEGGS